MKISKKIVTMLLMLAIVIATLNPFQAKLSKAANYLSAPTLPLNGVWSSDYYITETDYDHWYKIVVPSDGELNIQFCSYFTIHWSLYNDDLTKEMDWSSVYGKETTPETKKYYWDLSKGTYYLNVYDKYDTGKYKILMQFISYNVNDQAAISYVSPLNYQLGSTITGALTETDWEDWYKIVIPSTGYYSQKIVSYFTVHWSLYNDDLTKEIDWSSVYGKETTPETQKRDVVLSKGTYYVQIYSKYNTGKYTFQFNALTQQSCNHDYNRTKVDATYFSKGYSTYKCSKCGKTYKGDYTAKKTLGKGYISSGTIGKKKVKISFYSISGASGYQIRYSTNKNMKKSKIVKVGRNTTTKTIKGLKRKKKYYFQVRGYVKSGSKVAYGAWSDKKYGKIR